MSVENFDSENITLDELSNGIINTDLCKTCHQQRSNLNTPGLVVHFVFGQKTNQYQIGNAFFRFDRTINNNGVFRLMEMKKDLLKTLSQIVSKKHYYKQRGVHKFKLISFQKTLLK